MSANAQDALPTDTMYICRNGSYVAYAIDQVDSVVFGRPVFPGEDPSAGNAVDLGLSVLWADKNVGADSPEDFGGFYGWGETEARQCLEGFESDYKYYVDGQYQSLGEDISGTRYDAARKNWGGQWRMPTIEEFRELEEKCTWTYVRQNGFYGNLVTGPNGNSIFIPAQGYGLYWSSSYYSEDTSCAYYLFFKENYTNLFGLAYPEYENRYKAFGIRAVKDKTAAQRLDDELGEVVRTYVSDVVCPTYDALKTNAGQLATACATLYIHATAGTMTQADIDAACEAFKNARHEWERSEAFLYGAATDNGIAAHIDTWPLDQDQVAYAFRNSAFLSGVRGSSPAKYVYEQNGNYRSLLGFHGLEYVLFRDGKNRTVEALKANEIFEGMTSVKGIDELAFAAAVSADIQNMTTLLAYGWTENSSYGSWLTNDAKWTLDGTSHAGLSPQGTSYGDYLLAAATPKGCFPTWQETMEHILISGCSNISHEVYTQTLGQAYRVATGQGGMTEDGDPESCDYLESPYSRRSFADCLDNMYSIRNTLYGTRDINATTPVQNSLITLMQKYNYSGLSALQTALTNALYALESAKNSGVAFVDNPGATQVKTCIDAVSELDNRLFKAGKWLRNLTVE